MLDLGLLYTKPWIFEEPTLSDLNTWEAFVEGYILDHGGPGANYLASNLDRALERSDELGFDRDDLLERRQIIDEVWAAYKGGYLVSDRTSEDVA